MEIVVPRACLPRDSSSPCDLDRNGTLRPNCASAWHHDSRRVYRMASTRRRSSAPEVIELDLRLGRGIGDRFEPTRARAAILPTLGVTRKRWSGSPNCPRQRLDVPFVFGSLVATAANAPSCDGGMLMAGLDTAYSPPSRLFRKAVHPCSTCGVLTLYCRDCR